MGNVRSLTNKTDELTALVNSQHVCSSLCFTETWFKGNIPDSLLDLDGFMLVRMDRGKQSGKKRGGGLAVFVNFKWCSLGHVKECICTPDLDLMAVGQTTSASMRTPLSHPKRFAASPKINPE